MPNARLNLPANVQAQDWEDRKKRIRRLYLEKGYSLKVVMDKMETPDFQPSYVLVLCLGCLFTFYNNAD